MNFPLISSFLHPQPPNRAPSLLLRYGTPHLQGQRAEGPIGDPQDAAAGSALCQNI